MGETNKKRFVPDELIASRILLVRGQKVMIDADIAQLYGVDTKRLNEQVKRNIDRFPDNFMFELTKDEKSELVAKCDHLERLKFSHVLPKAFTEHGILMVANVLTSERAI
ncbi:MAG: ORF6N domain-containing protein [Bacteroidota bacterium]